MMTGSVSGFRPLSRCVYRPFELLYCTVAASDEYLVVRLNHGAFVGEYFPAPRQSDYTPTSLGVTTGRLQCVACQRGCIGSDESDLTDGIHHPFAVDFCCDQASTHSLHGEDVVRTSSECRRRLFAVSDARENIDVRSERAIATVNSAVASALTVTISAEASSMSAASSVSGSVTSPTISGSAFSDSSTVVTDTASGSASIAAAPPSPSPATTTRECAETRVVRTPETSLDTMTC